MKIRLESKDLYERSKEETWTPDSHRKATGFLSLRRSKSPISTLELDEDSFFLAYNSWAPFIDHALGAYAEQNETAVATVYCYSTGSAPSTNSSHGEGHLRNGWHNAVFFGVVGAVKVVDVIQSALIGGKGVPPDEIASVLVDGTKQRQIHCAYSDHIQFENHHASFHIEAACVWQPYESGAWYTHDDSCPA